MDGAKTTDKDKDYYYILGVGSKASTDEIQAAYDKLYDRFGPHVSLNGQDPELMLKKYKDISEAVDVLLNPAKRKEYDRTYSTHNKNSEIRNLWGKLTGGPTGTDAQPLPAGIVPADDTQVDVEVTLREAIKGAQRQIRVEEQLPCTSCVTLKPVQRLKCEFCRGVGFIRNSRLEDIQLPPGMHEGKKVRIQLKGRFDQRANRHSDLVLVTHLRPHPVFTMNDNDICCTVPITILEAVLGGEVQVPTATGKVIMKVQPLTQSGRLYRLKGMGLAGGDLLVTVTVVVPSQISADELELFRKLRAVSTMRNPREELLQKSADQ